MDREVGEWIVGWASGPCGERVDREVGEWIVRWVSGS